MQESHSSHGYRYKIRAAHTDIDARVAQLTRISIQNSRGSHGYRYKVARGLHGYLYKSRAAHTARVALQRNACAPPPGVEQLGAVLEPQGLLQVAGGDVLPEGLHDGTRHGLERPSRRRRRRVCTLLLLRRGVPAPAHDEIGKVSKKTRQIFGHFLFSCSGGALRVNFTTGFRGRRHRSGRRCSLTLNNSGLDKALTTSFSGLLSNSSHRLL